MNIEDVATALLLLNTRTTPPCSTTNHRVASFGAWSIATGALKLRFGNTRSTLRATWGTWVGGESPPPLLQPPAVSAKAAASPVHRQSACILASSQLPTKRPMMAWPQVKLHRRLPDAVASVHSVRTRLRRMSVLAKLKARARELKGEVWAL